MNNNSGEISISTTLNNNGILNNNTGSLLSIYGTLNNNSGATLNNHQTLLIYGGGTLTNNGTLTNYVSGGVLTISGTLTNNSGASMINNPGGTLNNSGTFTNNGTMQANGGGSMNNSGMFINNVGGVINGSASYGAGTYTQTAGQMINNGTLTQTSINILGGVLSETGTINGTTTIGSGATVSPGHSPGTLTINGNFSSSGKSIFEIGGASSGLFDVLAINGPATFTGGNIEFDFINGYNPTAGTFLDFLLASSITGWNTLSVTLLGLNGAGWDVNPSANGEMLSITEQGTYVGVPEPSTMLLLGTGLAGLIGFRKKFKRS
ncbi:MAG: PEP-CTERM sorting domain-containing protein [Dissulfurispiraceae bacterium]